MTTLADLQSLVANGESKPLKLKRSTAELKRTGETLSAFSNGEGGQVLIGVGPDGRLVGREGADFTLRDIAATLGRFEPRARRAEPRGRRERPAGDRPRCSSRSTARTVRLSAREPFGVGGAGVAQAHEGLASYHRSDNGS